MVEVLLQARRSKSLRSLIRRNMLKDFIGILAFQCCTWQEIVNLSSELVGSHRFHRVSQAPTVATDVDTTCYWILTPRV